jgi:hypothetical protein
MTDAIKYQLKILDATGRFDDRESAEYVRNLAAIMACDRNDRYAKKWARLWLEEIRHQQELLARRDKIPTFIS